MHSSNGLANATKSVFRNACTVSIAIDASPERIWALLTTAKDIPRWTSTVTSIHGTIALGQQLNIRVPSSERTFKVKVVSFVAPKSLVWADGHAPMFRGTREYLIEARGEHGSTFTMTETFQGVMLPLIRKTLPDFVPVFTKYAADLRNEAEKTNEGWS